MSKATIRPWREGDDAALTALWAPLAGWTDPATYARKFDDPGLDASRVFVAELDERIVGHVMSTRRTVYVEGEWKAFGCVGHLVVHPAAQGLGIGRRLLGACDEDAERAGMRGVLMWTRTTYHPAFQMYLRDGYELCAQEVIHEIDTSWVADRLGPSPLQLRPLGDDDADSAARIRADWAEEAFPVSAGWDASEAFPPRLGFYEGDALVGTSAGCDGASSFILPGRDVREAVAACAERLLAEGRPGGRVTATCHGAVDRALSAVSHNREEGTWCTLIKHFGPPIDTAAQERVHGAVWPW